VKFSEPACLAIIPDHLLSASARQAVMTRALFNGTTADELILSEALMSEEDYYRLVAQKLNLPFSPIPMRITPPKYPSEAWQSRMVRLDPLHHPYEWLAAPKGRRLEHLLTQPMTSNEGISNLVIATPRILFASIMQSTSEQATQKATHYLPQNNPDASCHGLCHDTTQRIIPLVIALILALVLARMNISFSTMATMLLGPVLLIRLIILATQLPKPDPQHTDLADHELPHYSILVPLYREANLIPQLLASFRAMDYPVARREILFLIEEDDADTKQALTQTHLPYACHIITVAAGQPRTKPRALNVGLLFATGPLIVVYDAEDRPEPQQWRKAARAFAASPPETACFQAPLVIDNLDEGLFPHLFALEYAGLFDVVLPRLSHKKWPVALGGSSNHFRKEALSKAMAWDAWNVTEDADLGLRLSSMGYHVGYLDSATYEDAPEHWRDWFMQRRRWIKGWMMTASVHLKKPQNFTNKAGWQNFGLLVYHSLGLVSAILFWPLTLIDVPYLFYTRAPDWQEGMVLLLPLLCSLPVLLWPLVQASRLRNHPLSLKILLSLPFYFLCMTLAGWAGLFDFIKSPHHWNKTPHKPHG
jgi:cellulose synthase/poly-beta-1,6-N-acetylglucosamine synthase-like glycosyltransferase